MRKQNPSQKEALEKLKKMHIKCSPLNLIFHINQGDYDIVELLLFGGANPNTPYIDTEKYAHFPVEKAIYKNNLKIIKLLLAYGLDLNQKLYEGNSALLMAAEDNKKKIVKFLVEKGSEMR